MEIVQMKDSHPSQSFLAILTLLGIGIGIGMIIMIIVLNYSPLTPKEVSVGPVSFEIPTGQPQTPVVKPGLPIATIVPSVSTPRPSSQPVWQDLGVFYASDYVTLGDEEKWIVFQVWDGRDTSTTVHGVIEPGWFLRIPPPLQGTTWAVVGYDRNYIITRVMQMRDEVVQRDKIAVPPLVYVGANAVPPGYTSQIPNGWIIQY